MKEIIINKNDSGQRLDKFLGKLMPKIPKSALYKGLRKECVRVNGRHIKDGSFMLCEGDILKLYFNDEFYGEADLSFLRSKIVPEIVYEDENIIIVHKKQGICTHADESGGDNLLDGIKRYLYEKKEYSPESEKSFSPAVANRLDRNTGGLVIAAKNAEALRIINEKIREKEVKKSYICLVRGHLEEKTGEICGYILRGDKSVTMCELPTEGAKYAVTKYEVLEEFPEHSLVRVILETGRTHQIRVSFAHIGHAILGDKKYGEEDVNRKFPFSVQALYANRLSFDFTTPSGILEYLGGRVFEIENVNFAMKK